MKRLNLLNKISTDDLIELRRLNILKKEAIDKQNYYWAAEYRDREKEILTNYVYDFNDPGRYRYSYSVEEIDIFILKKREDKINQIIK